MSLNFPPFSTTGIGSVPFADPTDACRRIAEAFDIAFWPQMAQRSHREGMIAQCAEGMPYIRFDDALERVWVERDESDQLTPFYESCTHDTRLPITESAAAGLHAFIRMMVGRRVPAVKGHLTGPLTFALGLKDEQGKSVYFDEELREITSMLLQAKIRWQVDELKQCADRVIIFLDEPIFSAIGSSSYLGVEDAEVERLLADSVTAIHQAGGIAGVHCCGKSDWALVMRTGTDILSFDAFEYFETLALYTDDLRAFYERGGFLAWGIVPTSDLIGEADEIAVAEAMRRKVDHLCRHLQKETVRRQSLITPSCGTGSRTPEETEKIFRMIRSVKAAMG
ncbi:MAG TPA: hypothetical protein VLH56_01465 [Dissulfurispiraceae bacterium]|nr:hypothetical protein [Dissulfurispiraceae bacterium]